MSDLGADLYGDAAPAPDNSAVSSAILNQESANNPDAATSVDGAIGRAQITPGTWKQYARPDEDINNPDDNLAVHNRIIADLSNKSGGDPARIAVGYFSGPGNIAPADSDTPWKSDRKDGNGKSVSSYVSDVLGRMNPISDAQASESAPVDLGADLYGSPAQDKDVGADLYGDKQPSLIDALKQQSDSQYWHSLGQNPETKNFPNVKEEGSILPLKVTYNPDGTVDSTSLDPMAPLRHLATGIGDLWQQAENKSTDTTPEAVSAMAALSGAPSIAKGAVGAMESMAPKSLSNFLSDESSIGGPVGNIVKSIKGTPPPVYDPIATHSAISDAYGAAKDAAKPYFNLTKDIATGETANVQGLKPALDAMISDIDQTPFHEAKSELPYLKKQAAKIGDDGTMPLNDAVALKQSLNSNFNPKRFSDATDTPYSVLSGILDNSLDDAAARLPEFGKARELQNNNWLNTVETPFQNNPVLDKFWKPQDYWNGQSVARNQAGGIGLEKLPAETTQRANSMLNNIQNEDQLNAIREVLPPDKAASLSNAVVQNTIQKEGAGRLASLGKAVTGIPKIAISPLKGTGQVLTNAGRAIVPDLSPQGRALIDAAKAPAPTLSTKYQQPYQALKASLQQQQDLADEMQPMSYGPNQSPVPVTAPDIAAAKNQSQMTPASYAAMRQQSLASEAATKDGLRKAFEENSAWNQNKSLNEAARQQAVNNVYDQMQAPGWDKLSPMQKNAQTRQAIRNEIDRSLIAPENETETGLAMRNAGFAKGGIVKNREIHLTKKLEVKLGRKPKAREVELAQYVGAHGVHRLLNQKDVMLPAHKMFPQAIVKEKRELFFNKRKPYTVGQIKTALG